MEWNANGQVSLGYLFAAIVCAAFTLLKVEPRDPSEDLLPEEGGAPEPPMTEHGVVTIPDGSQLPQTTPAADEAPVPASAPGKTPEPA